MPVAGAGTCVPAAAALRVLLVEDTPASQKLVVHVLHKRGHVVATADDGRQALEMLREQHFDLVLMDVQMPVMDGFQAAAAIRAMPETRKSRVPVVAITAHAMQGDRERCLAAGMDGYIAKPINTRKLVELVERLAHSPAR
jgi:CheY-like chemotaxis protein